MTPIDVSESGGRATGKRALIAILCLLNLALGCAFLSPVLHRPIWDVPQFYFAGKLVRQGNVGSLYDPSAYTAMVEELRKTDAPAATHSIYFNRPAYDALFCLPLAYFSFRAVTVFFVVANLALLGFVVWKLPAWSGGPPFSRIWLFIFTPFLYTVAFGQDTLALTILVGFGLFLLRKGQEIPAGILIAAAAFKPHLIWTIPIVLIAGRRWKALSACLATGASLSVLSFALIGTRGLRQWIDLLHAPSTDSVPHLMGNIRAVSLYFGPAAAIACALVTVVSFVIVLKYGGFVDQFLSGLLVALVLSPHTYQQDYSLLAVVGLFAASALTRNLVLFPWPYLYWADNIIPFVVLALAILIGLAAKSIVDLLASRRQTSKSPLPCEPTLQSWRAL